MERNTLLLRSDLEEEALSVQERHSVAQQILDQVGELLRQADHALSEIEQEDMLGSAIVRGCQHLADTIGDLAKQIDQQSEDQRQAMAKAILEDARQQHSLLLTEEEETVDTQNGTTTALLQKQSSSELEELTNLSEDDLMKAIHAASSLMRDVEATLRAIDQDEADEIADVALTVAHLFVASLQSVHSTITPEDITPQQSRSLLLPSPQIEILEEEMDSEASAKTLKSPIESNKSAAPTKKQVDRLRVLWPPLGPSVASACDWGKEEASKHPLMAVALGITLWPAAVMTTVIGTPIVLADGIVQNLYSNFEDTPIIHGVERSAAQLYHTGRLTLLCGKLVGRQSLRVISRQVERNGGVGKIAKNAGDIAVHRITHPIETLHMVWDAAAWSVGAVCEALDQKEREPTIQELQQ